MAGNTVRIRAVLDDKVSGGLDKIRDRFDRLGKSKGAQSILQGVGVGLGVSAYGLLDRAVSGVISTLGDATKAAMEEEASVSRLGASLKANIPNWDGNTDAIERVLQARIKLGFSDDEQRESLARLVVATKDSTKALAIQRAAMDLARLKNVDLGTATDALIKVEGGQFRALKALGIQLKAGATSTDALRAVQKAAAGQAEAYAKTNAGKLLTSQVRVGEAMEKFGAITMPVVADAMVFAAGKVEEFSTAADLLTGKTEATRDSFESLTKATVGQLPIVGFFVDRLYDLQDAMFGTAAASDNMRDQFASDAYTMKALAFDVIQEESADMEADIKRDTRSAAQKFEDMKDRMVSAAGEAIDNAFDPLIARDNLLAANAEISAARRVLASGTATAAEKADARDTLDSVGKDQAEYLLELAEAGKTGYKAYKDGLASLKTAIANATGPTQAALQAVLDKILEIERAGKVVPINLLLSAAWGAQPYTTAPQRASGGPASGLTWVGEEGPELVSLPSGSHVYSNPQSMAMAGGGVSEVHTHIYLDGRQIAESVDRHSFLGLQRAPVTAGRV